MMKRNQILATNGMLAALKAAILRWEVNGTIHAGDTAVQHAQASLTIAYNDAAGRTLGVVGVAEDLGGQTLAPGLYKSTSTLAITGNLILDANGDQNAVFIATTYGTRRRSNGVAGSGRT